MAIGGLMISDRRWFVRFLSLFYILSARPSHPCLDVRSLDIQYHIIISHISILPSLFFHSS